ncbi:MAG: TetR family transcriptional regulator [Streptosporangiaceae bacterium]|jgi:AcrR family transcriptional regulator|nr:TetR family transcriptional regulator [Streptosporangiaceae bacterium]
MPTDRQSPAPPARPLRRDAQRNRDTLLAAAREAFAEEGLEAPLERIARRAGLAIGTLYRHFPSRLDLVEAIFAAKVQTWIEAGERALAMEDPWEALTFYLERVCELQAHDRGFNDLSSIRLPGSACMQRVQGRTYELSCQIVERAHRQGSLRPDVTPEDLALLIWAHSAVTEATKSIAPRAWRRHLALMLDAFRADRATPLSEPPLQPDEVQRAMLALGGSGPCGG